MNRSAYISNGPEIRIDPAIPTIRIYFVNRRVRIFACIFSSLFWLALACWLCSCSTDPNAGMVAARECGMSHYLTIERDGQPDSVAVFPHNGRWWMFHPSSGSWPMESTANPPPVCIWAVLDGAHNASWQPHSAARMRDTPRVLQSDDVSCVLSNTRS